MYDRGEVACHLCFRDKVLRDWSLSDAESAPGAEGAGV
jgi:hypothetical protein